MLNIVTATGRMRTTAMTVALAVAMLMPATGLFDGTAQAASAIKIVVNDTAITSMDIQGRARLLQLAMRMAPGAATKAAQEELIDEALRLADGRRRGVAPNEDQVIAALTNIATRSKMSLPQFEKALAQSGVPMETFKNRIRAQMVWGRIVRAKIQQDVKTESNDIILQMRNREKGAEAVTATDYVLQRVVFAVKKNASPAEIKGRKIEVDALRSKFRNCQDGLAMVKGLKEVAVINVGRKLANEVSPAIKDELEKTPEGHLTTPERSDFGFEMFAVCDKIEVTGEAALSSGLDADALDKRGEAVSKELTLKLRQDARITYR